MNEQAPPLADEADEAGARGARLLERHEFRVLEENWQSGPYRLMGTLHPPGVFNVTSRNAAEVTGHAVPGLSNRG